MSTDPTQALRDFTPQHDFLVCVDSDGCAFDTMGIKQRECFCPWMIAYFGLQPVAQAARECKEFADLFSKTRGANRHVTIKRILSELLPSHPAAVERPFAVPHYPHYFSWIDDPQSVLSNDGLRQSIEHSRYPERKSELQHVLEWSERVNWAVSEIVRDIPPFPGVRDSLQALNGNADVIVVSATPLEALHREWQEHGLDSYVSVIAGQEMGTKKQHIEWVAGSYPEDHVLMIGDAPGDQRSAQSNDVLFYPTLPGQEQASWQQFVDEAMNRFFEQTYAGAYQRTLNDEFDRALPEHPPWEVHDEQR